MKNPFYIFRIKHEERWVAPLALLYVVAWNVLVVLKYADKAFAVGDFNYHDRFIRMFHISGYDPMSWGVISLWSTDYNIYRHPLLAFFMYIPNQVNQGLMMLTGLNLATVVMGVILVFCGFYSFILLGRLFREVIGLKPVDSWLLSALTFSFAYVIVAISVPDHFALSMFMLILTLYVAGRKMKAGRLFTKWQTVLFFIVTAGISLNNGIKVFLANWFVNGKKFWRPANLLLAIVLPSLLLWGGARLEWKHFERPKYKARQEIKMHKDSVWRAGLYASVKDTMPGKDSAEVKKAYDRIVKQRIQDRYRRDHKKPWNVHKGTPIDHSEFGSWTDISTPRWPSLVENIFGEPIQLHEDHLLGDTLRGRPVIVNYHHAVNYVVEAIIVVLFLLGIWFGRRKRLMWLALSFFGFDAVIHFVLGFGLNEVYIMSPHWLFILTVCMGYLMKRVDGTRFSLPLRGLLLVLTLWLLGWNGWLYASYLL